MSGDSPDRATLSIGAVSKATGIPRETIRTWERRYGFPDPERNQAGHRVYTMQTVHQLRLISEALDAGYRPSNVVGEDIDQLRELLATSQAGSQRTGSQRTGSQPNKPEPSTPPGVSGEVPPDDRWVDAWLDAAARFDGDALETHLYRAWNRFGGLRFLEERVGPFLTALGEAWLNGDLNVSHEHFTSERLRDFLTRQWRPLSDRASGAMVVMANLPGEQHCLGLHMAAVIIALAGCEISFLGANTPLDEISAAAAQQRSTAVLISVSKAYDSAQARQMLDTLTAEMDSEALLVVGGSGRPEAVGPEIHLDRWSELYDWAREIARQGR